MNKAIGLCVALGLNVCAYAQADSLEQKNMNEVVLYASKFAERSRNIVQHVDVITAQRIAELNTPTMAELLASSGNVFVQKSQMGGGSPVLRGFEASRVLLIVDGIRMNNAIYRAGHLQNAITIDQNMLERVEVLYGPASTLYGSDALGGAVLFRSKMPQLAKTDKAAISGSAFTRYGSAANERTIHADASIGGRKWAWLQSYTFSDFNDLRMGSHFSKNHPDFGRRPNFIAHINGIDSVVKNSNDLIQRYSGYAQWDIAQKVLFQQSQQVSHLLNLQWSSSTNIPRYDRLQDVRNGRLRWAQWYYGPQNRGLAAYELNIAKAGLFDNIRFIGSYQHIEESRHQRAYRSTNLDHRVETLGVGNLTLDAKRFWGNNELTVGVDAQINGVQSRAQRENIRTGEQSPLDSRYPNGRNNMNYYGVYVQHLIKLHKDKLVLNDGLRLQAVTMRSTIADNSILRLPFTAISQDNQALTGNVGVAYMPTKRSRFTASAASGFRAPNIDDASRVFESGNNQLIVPNSNIKPEYTYTFDLGASHLFGGGIRVEANGFFTLFRNAIALSPFTLNEQSTVTYNGAQVPVFANQNVNKAYLYGTHASVTANITARLELYSTITYTYGRLKQPDKATMPLDHIPPVYGKTSLKYSTAKWKAEAFALYNGWKRLKDYNPNGEDNLQYATPAGTPSWYTLNLNTSWTASNRVTLQGGIENIQDRNYRVFASGFSAPGRNAVLSVRIKI